MKQTVLDGVMAIEAKAAKRIDEAKARARELRQQVEADLDRLAKELDDEAERQIADYTKTVETTKAAQLAGLDGRLEAARAALEGVKAERVGPLAEEVTRLLEQRGHGN